MTLSDLSGKATTRWRVREAVVVGWRAYLAENPPKVLIWVTGVRGVLQAVFFVLLGGTLAGGFERRDAFVGAMAIVMTGPNVIGVANVPLADKEDMTFWRVRTGVLHPAVTLVARALPYPAVATLLVIVQAAVTAVALGVADSWLHFLRFLPFYTLMACTAAVMGLAAAALSIGKRADVLAPNLVAYLILLGSGAVLPPGRVAWLDAMGSVLPARHALAAVRHASAGQPWLGDVIGEVLVGLLWAAIGFVGVQLQGHRARRLGHDDFE